MATFWSHKRLLALSLGEKVTKVGDKEVKSPIEAAFENNIFRTDDQDVIAKLRAHPRFGKTFHETDEKADRETLIQNKKIIEKGQKGNLSEVSQGATPRGRGKGAGSF